MKTNRLDIKIDTNAISDDGKGVIRFRDGLILSDESEQVNGTRYDHSTTDISNYNGEVFADHSYDISKLVGTMFGVAKQGQQIVAEGIKFAMANPLGRLAHDLVTSGQLRNVSIGTSGPEPEDDGLYKEHSLHEISLVGLGNNRNARMGELITHALNKYEKEGMDVSPLKQLFTNDKINKEGDSMAEPKNQEPDAPKGDDAPKKEDTPTVAAPAEPETPAAPAEPSAPAAPADEGDKVDENAVKAMVENAIAPYKKAFDENAKEPEWNMGVNTQAPIKASSLSEAKTQFKNMDKWELAGLQYLSFLNSRKGDQDAAKTLSVVNELNLERLKEEGKVRNTLTLSDFGNFVTSPELQTTIEGYRTDYSEALRAFAYQQTQSRDFSFLTRSGDIDLDDVDGLDDSVGTDTLKPVKEYEGSVTTSRLQEMAAVTPISTTANLFSAADLIQDATLGYRNAADKRFAQLPVARLEQAMEADATRSYSFDATGSDTNGVKASNIRRAIFSISQGDGVLVMTEASYGYLWDLMTQLGSSNSLGETIVGDNPVRRLWGKSVVVVPNDLMPTLDDSTTYRTIPEVRPLAGGSPVTVTVNHAIFYLPLATWKGRTNGGLRFDISAEASYEQDGTTKSAFQRNEVLLRGAIFRGGAITDPSRVRGIRAEAVIS